MQLIVGQFVTRFWNSKFGDVKLQFYTSYLIIYSITTMIIKISKNNEIITSIMMNGVDEL